MLDAGEKDVTESIDGNLHQMAVLMSDGASSTD